MLQTPNSIKIAIILFGSTLALSAQVDITNYEQQVMKTFTTNIKYNTPTVKCPKVKCPKVSSNCGKKKINCIIKAYEKKIKDTTLTSEEARRTVRNQKANQLGVNQYIKNANFQKQKMKNEYDDIKRGNYGYE